VRNFSNVAVAASMILFGTMFWTQVGIIAGAIAQSKIESSAIKITPRVSFQGLIPIY